MPTEAFIIICVFNTVVFVCSWFAGKAYGRYSAEMEHLLAHTKEQVRVAKVDAQVDVKAADARAEILAKKMEPGDEPLEELDEWLAYLNKNKGGGS